MMAAAPARRHYLTTSQATARQIEARFRLLSEHSSDLVRVVKGDGTILYASPSHRPILGYSPDDLVGRTSFHFVHPDDLPRMLDEFNTAVGRGEAVICSTYRVRHADGSWRVIEVAATNHLDDPDLLGLVVNGRDVTERLAAEAALRSSERRFRTLIEKSFDGVMLIDAGGRIRYASPSLERILGYGEAELLGTGPLDGIHPADAAGALARLADLLRHPGADTRLTCRLRHKDCSYRCIEAVGTNLLADQSVAALVLNLRDITEQRQAHRLALREAERARLAAEELARLRSDYVGFASHELRTPLTAIVGFGELLQERWRDLSEVQRLERIGHIVQAANRQKRLVEDLLTLTRLEGSQLPLQPLALSLSALARQAAAEVRGSYPGQRILLRGTASLGVYADPVAAHQVLTNLLDNAAKYSPEGSTIRVRWSREQAQVAVRVIDQGAGVPESGREHLFTRFGRVPGSRPRAGRVGTGLGLYLSRGLAEAMGGDLDLEATGPEGSTFRLRLPPAPPGQSPGAP